MPFALNGTIVVFVVSFLIFMWLLDRIMLKPMAEVLEKRARLIESDMEAGKQAGADAQALVERYEEDLRKIRGQAQSLIADATAEGNRQRAAQLERIAKDGQSKLDKTKAELSAEREALIDKLVAEEKDLVEGITRKVLDDDSVQLTLDTGQVRKILEET